MDVNSGFAEVKLLGFPFANTTELTPLVTVIMHLTFAVNSYTNVTVGCTMSVF
jgi:hypothetical protein